MSVPRIELRNLSATQSFLAGTRFALLGMRVVASRPWWWGYLLAPLAILLTFFVGAALVSWTSVGWLMGAIWTPGPESSWWMSGAWVTLGVIVRLVLVGLVGLVLYFLAGLVATPFNDRLSDKVERMMLGQYEEPFSWRVLMGDLANSLAHSSLSLALWFTVMVCAFFLNLLPIVGSVLSLFVGTVATAVFMGRESLDGCMSRRRMSYGHKYRLILSQFPLVFGFGLVGSVLLWIPFLNFVMLPIAVVGGTLLYCELERQGLVPDPRGNLGYRPIRHVPPAELPHYDDLSDEEPGKQRAPVPQDQQTLSGGL
jgi:CysZ protein